MALRAIPGSPLESKLCTTLWWEQEWLPKKRARQFQAADTAPKVFATLPITAHING